MGKIVKRKRESIKTDTGKNIEISKYNKLTGRSVYKEKDIAYRQKGEPREKYVEKQVVKRDKNKNWKSELTSKVLKVKGKKVKKQTEYNTYTNGKRNNNN